VALTITIEGKGVIANCDALTNDTGGTGTGDWGELGGGAISVNPDVYIYGNSSIGSKYASKSGYTYFDIGAGNELDFTPITGSEKDEFIYMWINISAGGALQTVANNGLAIRLGTSTADYRDYTIAGSDDTNGWTGGWKLFVLDPTKAGTVTDSGTYDLSSIRYIGLWIDTAASVRADSIWIDQIAVGTGIYVYGTSTNGWEEIVNYCTDYTNRAWGAVQERDNIYYIYGKISFGVNIDDTDFSDSARVIQFGTSQYWSGSAWVSTFPATGSGILVEEEDIVSSVFFTDGIAVGTDQGRSGSTFIGNNDQDVFFKLSGNSSLMATVSLFGTSLKDMKGPITLGDTSNHKFYSVSFTSCAQFEPIGGPLIRNCVFAETSDIDASLLWNESINVRECTFIANTLGAAIEHTSAVGTPYDYFDLTFSGNTFDGLNTSGTDITVNNNGTSDASLDEGANTITYLSSATLTMVVKDVTGTEVVGAYAYIDDNNLTPFIMNTVTNASGIASVGHTAGAVAGATWRIRKYGYKPFIAIADIPASGTKEIPVTLIVDPQQS